MKRRSFIFSLAALSASPAMSFSGSVGIKGATAQSFANAQIIARAHNRCSPAMLQRLLRVDATVAAELNSMLLNRGIITAAGSDGMAMAVNPTNTNCIPTQARTSTNLSQGVKDMREKVRAFVEDDTVQPVDPASENQEPSPGTALSREI